jgi:hypothetical protein
VIGRATIRIQLSEVAEENDGARILTLPWTAPSPYRKREIIQGTNDAKISATGLTVGCIVSSSIRLDRSELTPA